MCLSLFREIKTTRSNCCCLVTIKLNIKKDWHSQKHLTMLTFWNSSAVNEEKSLYLQYSVNTKLALCWEFCCVRGKRVGVRIHWWWGVSVTHLPFCSFSLPPDSTPLGSMPVGVRPFSVSTLSLSSLSTENTLAIFPMARILLRMTSLRAEAVAPSSSSSVDSSSLEQMLNTFTSISVTFSPTKGKDQVKTSMKLGSQ